MRGNARSRRQVEGMPSLQGCCLFGGEQDPPRVRCPVLKGVSLDRGRQKVDPGRDGSSPGPCR